MLARGKAGRRFDIISEAWDAKHDGVRRFFRADPRACCHATLTQRARQPQNASHGADAVLLLGGKVRKRTILCTGFCTAMVTDRGSEHFPIFVAPAGRHGETKQEFARGFMTRSACPRLTDAMCASRGVQNPVN